MKNKTLVILAVIAVIFVVGAIFAVQQRDSASRQQVVGERLFPGLVDQANDVAKLTVFSPDGEYAMVRVDDGWILETKDGYPAKFDKVRGAILAVADTELISAKTNDPSRHGELTLGEPDGADGAGTRVILTNADDQPLASFILGKSGRGANRHYVRRSDETQTWLAQSRLDLGAGALDWVEKVITTIDRDRVHKVTIDHPDGSQVVVDKAGLAGSTIALADIPEGATIKDRAILGGIVSALTYLAFDDVANAESREFSETSIITTVKTFDGLSVVVESMPVEDQVWIKMSARFDETDIVVPSDVPEETAEEGDAAAGEEEPVESANDSDEAETETAPDQETDDGPLLSAEEAQQEADDLNAVFQGWVFALAEPKAERLISTMADIVDYPEPDLELEDGDLPPLEGGADLPDNIPGLESVLPNATGDATTDGNSP